MMSATNWRERRQKGNDRLSVGSTNGLPKNNDAFLEACLPLRGEQGSDGVHIAVTAVLGYEVQ